jgi:7-carboxy-7-deazaguanine synthase
MRVSEVYASTQGEGPNVGRTTVFVRFGGCNLRCPGWPCDTQHAIDPAFRKEWTRTSPSDLVEQVAKVAELAGAQIITLTGGEPFLQPAEELREFVDKMSLLGYQVEAFTNGTLLYPDWATRGVAMIMDWKLQGSGEFLTLRENRLENLVQLKRQAEWVEHSVKFVCKDFLDLEQAEALWSLYVRGSKVRTYYGRVWDGDITNAELVGYVMERKLPWSLNVQMHNYIWPANERGR